MPVDHYPLLVPKPAYEPVVKFLTDSLAHLGFKKLRTDIPGVVGLGETHAYFWVTYLSAQGLDEGPLLQLLGRMHIAFEAENAQQVKDFYDAAIKAGGKDNGKPGLREDYGKGYYAAFVRDPTVGLNWEVVTRNGDS